MRGLRFFLKKNKKMPDLVIIPVDTKKPRKNANYIEKMIFYRERAWSKLKILIFSKELVDKIGGFDPSLGFGEDRLFQERAFELVNVDKCTRREYGI